MGLFFKLRSGDRAKSQPLVTQPYVGHAKTYTSELSAADCSEFLLTASASSHSLVDTHRRAGDAAYASKLSGVSPTRPSVGPQDSANHQNPQQNRHSMPYIPTGPAKQGGPPLEAARPHSMAANSVSAHSYDYQQGHQQGHQQTPQMRPPNQNYHYAKPALPPSPGRMLPTALPRRSSLADHSQASFNFQSPGQHFQFPPQGQYAPPRQGSPYGQAVFAALTTDTSAEFSEEESTSEMESEYEDDSQSDAQGQKHPYYQQWKDYYAAMASYQSLVHQKRNQSNPRHSMYTGPVSPPLRPFDPNARPDYFYQHAAQTSTDNDLLRNSRRSTLKLNRSSSVPSLVHRMESQAPRSRCVSVNATVPPEESQRRGRSTTDLTEDFSGARPSRLGSTRMRLIAHGLLTMRMADHDEAGEISDYEAFLFDGSEHDISASDIQPPTQAVGQVLGQASPESQPSSVPEAKSESISPIREKPGSKLREVISALGPPKRANSDSPPGDLNRQSSSASTSSYNSLQSETNFSVGRAPYRLATPSSSTSSKKKRSKSRQSFVPPMQGPPPPILSGGPAVPNNDFYPQPTGALDPRRHTMAGNVRWSDAFSLQQMQQQIQQLQQMQQMMPMYGNNNGGQYNGLPPPQNRSSDKAINEKIEEFIELRRVIASGNKSVEYRLKWMKMLIVAVQYKLYAYTNIRGDTIPQDQVSQNKQFFIKSSVTHLRKLLKEFEGPKLATSYSVFADVCYVYGCLLKHEFVEKYEQDFGIERDDAEAEMYLRKCLELNPTFFKAHYALAEIYESHGTEELFDQALEHYKESARLGYYRGIYRVALIYLMVPKVRSVNCIRYFRNLSEIDMQSKDIVLSGSDRDELEEVVGLGLYQLGRIYEGVYPGDLTADDDFVKESLAIAPVNYARSLTYYNHAAKHHCLLAQVKLGHVYENGDLNRNQNANKSIQWFIKASTSCLKFKRHPEAMLGISRWFINGSNGESKHIPYPDTQRAVEWCKRACNEFNHPEAVYTMGVYVLRGLVVGNADEWFEEAARLGYQPHNEVADMQEDETYQLEHTHNEVETYQEEFQQDPDATESTDFPLPVLAEVV